ncbi:hypothetical protein I4U23_005153 [Adineta vaga]|nr:hypothetical protein I4U23_005153 [Adineta vaga]
MDKKYFIGLIIIILLINYGNSVEMKSYSKQSSIIENVPTNDELFDEKALPDETILKVAPFPYIPDPYNGNNAHLLQFIRDEFKKVYPKIRLNFHQMNTNDDFYDLTFLSNLLQPNESGYDVVEIDTLVLGDLVDIGLVSPQVNYTYPSTETYDWHPAAYSAVQVNQATYAYPHIMCAFFLFTHGDVTNMNPIHTLEELEKYVNKTGAGQPFRLVGNLDSSWTMTALWMDSHRDQSMLTSRAEAEALHGYEYLSFKPMKKFARLCDLFWRTNPCLDGTFKKDVELPAELFGNKHSPAMFGYSERLFYILKYGLLSNPQEIKIQPIPFGDSTYKPSFFNDAYVFRRNLSPEKLTAAQAFVKFMASPRMQAAVVANEDFSTTKPYRYLLPMARSTYFEPVIRQDRFYASYFHDPSARGTSYPNTGVLKTRQQLVNAIKQFIKN